jgi:hypothetical protein
MPELGQIGAHRSGVDAVEGVMEVVGRKVCDAVSAKGGLRGPGGVAGD